MSAINLNINDRRCESYNSWRSVDAHSQNGAMTVLLSLLPIKAANTWLMPNSDQSTVELPYLHNHESWMLRWCSFYCIVHSTSAAIVSSFHHDLNLLVVFLPDWDLALGQSRVQYHSCTVRLHRTKIYVSCQMLHCACYTSVYRPIFTSCCIPFAHNISLTKTLSQNT
jgi:hypothetical protein